MQDKELIDGGKSRKNRLRQPIVNSKPANRVLVGKEGSLPELKFPPITR
jgi:hypothetical protein